MFPPDACQASLSWDLPCFDEGGCRGSLCGLMARLFLLSLSGFSPGTSLHFSGFISLLSTQTHQRVCVTTMPWVCASPHRGNLFLPGLTGAFYTGLACCYCLSLLSITQIGATCIHMHAFGAVDQPLAVPAFVFPSNNRWLQPRGTCRASFAWCKSAHMWAGVISICAHQVCWIRAGAAEKGSPLGLIVLCFGTPSSTLFCIKCWNEMCNTLCWFARDG